MRKTIALSTALAAALALPSSLSAAPGGAADCAEYTKQIEAAMKTGEAETAERLYKEAEAAHACVDHERQYLGRITAFAFYTKAYQGQRPEEEKVAILRQGLNYGRPWQLAATVGDLDQDAKSFETAAKLYADALDDIRNEKFNPDPPANDVIATIIKKAETASLLSPVYVKQANARGNPAGLACTKFRGFTPNRTAVPIEFEYNKTDFTEKGSKAAADMLRILQTQGSPEITLIGHTDMKGTDSFNQDLSEKRSKATAEYLSKNGYAGKIATAGRGKKEPFQPADATRYNQTERDQMDRRVELARKGGAESCEGKKK